MPSDIESETEKSVDLTQTPCEICGPSTCDEPMIGCDGCFLWFHCRCVEIQVEHAPKKWYCQNKDCQEKAQQMKDAKKSSRSRKTTEESDKSKKGSSLVDARVKALEEKQKKQLQELEAEITLKRKEKQLQRAFEQKKMEMELKMRAEEEEQQMVFQEEMLRKKQEQIDRMKANQRAFEKKMADLDKELVKLSTSKVPKSTPKKADEGKARSTGAGNKSLKLTKANVKKLAEEFENGGAGGADSEEDGEQSETEDEEDADSEEDDEEEDEEFEVSSPSMKSKPGKKKSGKEMSQKRVGPTKAQLAARKGLTFKLPKFSGKPSQWPLFYAAYKTSNETCGYMNHENLMRLQESLEGEALELVAGQLLLPESIPRVIEKLRRHYGRPEQLLQNLLDKVNQLVPPKPDNLRSFVPFGNAVEQLCGHIEAADLRQHLVNPLLIKSLVAKLPDREKREWVHYRKSKGEPTLRTLTDFLMEIVEDACEADVDVDLTPAYQSKAGSSSFGKKKPKEKGALYCHAQENPAPSPSDQKRLKPCKICQNTEHRLRHCADFKKLSYADRLKIVTRDKLCHVCLNEHSGTCRFKIRCSVGDCREHHNSLMHPVGNTVGLSAHIRSNCTAMFRMVPVQLHCGGTSITVLAFLDEGASVTLLERKLADRLGVVGVQERLTIRWTADVTREERESRRMNVWASGVSRGANGKLLLHSVRTVGKLMLPHHRLDVQDLAAQYPHMRDLPIESYDGQPELLIGLNNIHSFAPIEAKVGAPVEPIAVRCKLGWTVYGPRHSTTVGTGNFIGHHQAITNEDLHELLKSHYALEQSVVEIPQESSEDRRAREILERTTKRIGDRFETGLLFKSDEPRFPDSYPMAVKRMKQLEKRLQKNPELQNNVNKQIDEYQEKGYAHLATVEELSGFSPDEVWYLPLNVVQNPKKPDKVRLVWDAAATVLGVSLNSLLLKGPDMLVPLVKVLCGFREWRLAFGGDVKEMFHQMKIRVEDRQKQRFLYRKDPNDPPSIYVMDVATFGSTCSPCSAQFVKNKNADEFAGRYPEAAAAIIKRHYVDDYFDSVESVEEAVKLAREVRLVHRKGGFEIRNWVSNSPEVLQSLGETKPVAPVHFNQDKQTSKERVLGVIWDPNTDEFAFSTTHREGLLPYLFEEKRPTKRIVASCVMGFFDPLGLLSPFTIHGKIIIQHLWRSSCDWDQEIDTKCWELWKQWTELLPEVEAIRIPRCYIGDAKRAEVESLEVHIFTDASEHAYGCVAYLRAVVRGMVHCKLMMSRAKVAPIKRQSIPRLELMGAVLGARLSQSVLENHSYDISRTVFWTDSRTVCSWINSDQHRYKQFVAFRVGEILELTKVSDWRWTPTKLNIADVLTKWGQGPPLQSDGVWFKGPEFLYRPEDTWPSKESVVEETEEEVRGAVLFHEVVNVEAISSWTRLLRVTATVVRFIDNCHRKRRGESTLTTRATTKQYRILVKAAAKDAAGSSTGTVQTPLKQDELKRAEKILWRHVQWDSFPDEMSILTNNLQRQPGQSLEKVKKNSRIYKCSPVIDDEGVLRMDGRLANSEELPFDKKYPVILSRSHEITQRLIQHYHEEFGHANSETVFNEMRQRFQIPNLRVEIQKVADKCIWCKVHKCLPRSPRMSPLPVDRVTPNRRPFSSVGIDYLGPVEVVVGRRKEKRWVAVFTCLAVRAVHLEVVHSLTTESCRMAITRFRNKFGAPSHIYSDNATCFQGANNEMIRMASINQQCAESIASPSTAWHFNPPGTPHMGGIWERMVRSVKTAMRALDDGRKLTDEILATILAEAAEMINMRPLTYLPQDSAETEALTPNHFLRGTVTCADTNTEGGLTELAEVLRNDYQRSQYLADKMWARWIKEYLPTINNRSKWFDDQKPLKEGDLVFVVDGKNRKSWKRGIVEAVIKGSDGRVRQVDVRTANRKIQRRGVVNLAVLEVQ
ncbi:uncharacterized protein LOC128746160 [Sabethes cyaneus]|uniref:uncharacterized protein LOC128746160 n=1 Tax=Sabethes cyaneus TaxID=53552 RepID=UPI00237E2E15|nr:uncharacterized protein LOC128746160 [Sabethes cyaneus]